MLLGNNPHSSFVLQKPTASDIQTGKIHHENVYKRHFLEQAKRQRQ
jgi:hypothetical protein